MLYWVKRLLIVDKPSEYNRLNLNKGKKQDLFLTDSLEDG